VAEAVNVIYRTYDSLTDEMYIGSKKNYIHGKYFGSPRNKRAKEIIKTRPETLWVEVLETVQDCKSLIEREIYWQKIYDVVASPLYWNQVLAGKHFSSLNKKQDAELIAKRFAKIKGRKHRPETIEKMRRSAKAIIHKPLTEEHRKNITKGLMGHKSRPRTEEEKAHHSRVMKGKKFPNRKKYIFTEEHRESLRKSTKAAWDNGKLKNVTHYG